VGDAAAHRHLLYKKILLLGYMPDGKAGMLVDGMRKK